MRRSLKSLSAAVTPKRAAAAFFTVAAMGAAAAPAVATFTAGAAPAASVAMSYNGPTGG